MRGERWVRWALNQPSDVERLCAWLVRRYWLTGATTVTTCDTLRLSPIRRVQRLDPVLRELAKEGALAVLRLGRARWIEYDPVAVKGISAVARARFPDLYRQAPRGEDSGAAYQNLTVSSRLATPVPG